MNVANLQLVGLLMAVAAINNVLVNKGRPIVMRSAFLYAFSNWPTLANRR